MDNLAVVTLENPFMTNDEIHPIPIDYPINLSGIKPYALGWGFNSMIFYLFYFSNSKL